MQYDIAVIVLKNQIVPGQNIKAARLPDEDAPCPKGRRLVLSGWGTDVSRFLIRSQDSLWAVSQECLNASSCPLMNDLNFTTNTLCVGDPENLLNGGCGGDSGGTFLSECPSFSSIDIFIILSSIYICIYIYVYI